MADQPRDGAPLAAFLSFRFGATDGVSVVTRTWIAAFESFGFRVVTIAGNGDADRLVPGLEIGAGEPPSPRLLAEALEPPVAQQARVHEVLVDRGEFVLQHLVQVRDDRGIAFHRLDASVPV